MKEETCNMTSGIPSKHSYSDTFLSTLASRTESFEESSKGIEDIAESLKSTASWSESPVISPSDSDTSSNSRNTSPHSVSTDYSQTYTDDENIPVSVHTEEKPESLQSCSSESFTRFENADDASFSDTQSYRSELSFVDDSQDTTSGQYSYSETFEPSVFDTQTTYSATSCSVPVRTLEPLKEESDFEESLTERKDTTSTFERSHETKTSYSDTFELPESFSFRLHTEDIREISEAELAAAEVVEAQEEFVNKICERLKQKKTHLPTVDQRKVIQEDPVLVSYCRKKINQLNSGGVKKKGVLSEMKQGTKRKTKSVSSVPLEAYGLNPAILERIKLTNVMERMKKISQMEIHEVSKCKNCRKQQRMLEAAAMQRQFLSHYSQKLLSENMDEKVTQHIIKMNTVSLLGEIVCNHPHTDQNSSDLLYEYQRQILRRKERDQRL